jgi:hypothetical protein
MNTTDKKKKKKSWGESGPEDFSLGTGMAEDAKKKIINRRNQLDDLLDEIDGKPKRKSK